MVVAAGGIALPDLDQRVGHRLAVLVEHAAVHDDALAERRAHALARQVVLELASSRSLASSGPVISDRVCGSTIAGWRGERPTVDL